MSLQRALAFGCVTGAAYRTVKFWAGNKNSTDDILSLLLTPLAVIIGAVPASISVVALYSISPTLFITSDVTAIVVGGASAFFIDLIQNKQ